MPYNVPGYNPAFDSIYNPSGFNGQITSDFLRLEVFLPPSKRILLISLLLISMSSRRPLKRTSSPSTPANITTSLNLI